MGFPVGLGEASVRRGSLENLLASSQLRLAQRQRESDEDNQKEEECSSTESTHQEVRTPPPRSPGRGLSNGDRQVRRTDG